MSPTARLLLQNKEELRELASLFRAGLTQSTFPACRELLNADCREYAAELLDTRPKPAWID